MTKDALTCKLVVLLVSACAANATHAAGGPFEVDDAGVLDRGRCQVETWAHRSTGGFGHGAHVGPACRVGEVEIGASLDAIRAGGRGDGATGLQVKWVTEPIAGRLAIGIVAGVAAGWRGTGNDAVGAYVPLTWTLGRNASIHLNAGVDAVHDGTAYRRIGASVEWSLSDRDSLIVEALRRFGERYARAGVRHRFAADWIADLAIAAGGAPHRRMFTAGLTWEFDR